MLDLNSIEQALVRPQGRAYGSGPKPVRSGSAKQSSWGRFSSKDLNEDALLTSGEVEARGDATRRKPKPGKVEVRGEGGAATHAKVPEHACPLDELRDNAVLAREIRTADGSLFMHAGTHLTPPIISILKDLNQLGHPVSSIWIEGQP